MLQLQVAATATPAPLIATGESILDLPSSRDEVDTFYLTGRVLMLKLRIRPLCSGSLL